MEYKVLLSVTRSDGSKDIVVAPSGEASTNGLVAYSVNGVLCMGTVNAIVWIGKDKASEEFLYNSPTIYEAEKCYALTWEKEKCDVPAEGDS